MPVDWLSLCAQHWQQRKNPGRWQQRWQFWRQQLQVSEPTAVNFSRSAEVLLWGFADRVAQRRSGDVSRYLLSYGSGASLGDDSLSSEWLLALQLTLHDGDSDSRIRLALPLTWRELAQHPAIAVEQYQQTRWQGPTQRLVNIDERRLGAIVLESRESSQQPSAQQRQQAFVDYLQAQGLARLNWCDASQQLLARLRLLAQHQPQALPFALTDDALLAELAVWAAPYWQALLNLQQLHQWRPYEALLARCDYALQQQLQQQCPSQWQAPSGRLVSIDYCQPQPVAAIKLQEAFGEPHSPTLVYGKVTLTLDLLSPAGRLLQRTQDLASFWQGAYQQVKKEMRGRYPKHPWPDDPSSAQATLKTKRQM
ncbi:ATP-dependent helicase C-terminal domain-containing protein [Idiomarina xiamenensis]|uniref:Helicase, ATP-dependent n=1 Tax=Idiomarina xiamenensis 10-D-4 TaxID=740709 RepID=K2LC77_9GAMM|nr:ATP-dependent helicase C-terminal domain-containing protein [Idiomarina xiamenensis]EKE87460.1 helicase, ATP-dependent [Idiomarina xiamenensis 10-D-4]